MRSSIVVPVEIDRNVRRMACKLLENETHNHPTEIELFGGAATRTFERGAIRDLLVRTYLCLSGGDV
ncbi:MAG: hypothetical protein ACLTH3_11075 [Lachnospira sp.]